MTIYEVVAEIFSSNIESYLYIPWSLFKQSDRAKLQDSFDLEAFDLFKKANQISIIYRSDRRNDENLEYRKNEEVGLAPFTDKELKTFDSLDWEKLPRVLKAHLNDVIWLCNHKYDKAIIAAEEYFELYHEWFNEVSWVQCVDYISRAVELAAKLGNNDKKDSFLNEVFNDLVRLDGNDSSFLSISLIELILNQNYQCDYNSLIAMTDKLISKNEGNIGNSYVLEQAYYVKANIYKKQKDTSSENKIYVQYADALLQDADRFVKEIEDGNTVDNRNCFMAENNIKKAIELYQNHGASGKAVNAQKQLVDIQKLVIKNMQMHEFKIDVSNMYKEFVAEYNNHSIHELIWDVVFAFGFQSKQKIREEVTKNSSIVSLIPMHILGSEGQTEFMLPGLDINDENSILLHMYYRAKEYELIEGQTAGAWFIQYFRERNLQETDLSMIFENNAIIPKGQEKDVQRGVYYGLIGRMSDALDKLAPKAENIIRNLAEMCGDLMTYYDSKEGIQQKRVLSQVFAGEKLNECVEEDILFTLDGLLQQKAGSNIRNRVGHGLSTEGQCNAGDCIYFVMIVLKFCAMFSQGFLTEFEKRAHEETKNPTLDVHVS